MATAEPGFAFWILSLVILVSGLMVVSLKNLFHCALFLVLSLLSVAGIFVMLDAEFLAAAQVLIYVGAVAILIIFAVMLTSKLAKNPIAQSNKHGWPAFLVCLVFAFSAVILIYNTQVWRYTQQPLPENNSLEIGRYLLTTYMIPFEVVSILLLAAMVGVIVLVRGEKP